jgi:hypothetical protein
MANERLNTAHLSPKQLEEIGELFDRIASGELQSESGAFVSPHLASTLPQDKLDEIIAGVALELGMTPAQVVERFVKTLREKARQKMS